MAVEGKVVELKIEDGKLMLRVDSNKDGQPLLTMALELSEVADEALAFFSSIKK